jgi:fluoride exporter
VTKLRNAVVIVIGGMLGTSVRLVLETTFGTTPAQWPWTTFGINVVGSFALGALLELLATNDDTGWRRSVRLGVGTGILGGFTTYSTFSVETVELLRDGAWFAGLGYAVASLIAGVSAAIAAMLIVRAFRRSASEADREQA